MSLDKAIQYKKEYRKPYRKAKSIDPSCRNHGSCEICKGNRLFARKREEEKMKIDLKFFEKEDV